MTFMDCKNSKICKKTLCVPNLCPLFDLIPERENDITHTTVESLELKNKTGCGLFMCKQAIRYAKERNGGEEMALAFLKAKSIAVKTECSFDERVKHFMRKEK